MSYEKTILNELKFDIGGVVVAHDFVPHLVNYLGQDMDAAQEQRCKQLIKWCLLDDNLVAEKPPLQAASSIAAVLKCNTALLFNFLHLEKSDIAACRQQLNKGK